jgi:hypothetical protein
MWKPNGKTTTLLLFLDSLFPETETDVRCFLWKQNNPDVNYYPIWLSKWRVSLEEITCSNSTWTGLVFNLCLHNGRLATTCLSHGTALKDDTEKF